MLLTRVLRTLFSPSHQEQIGKGMPEALGETLMGSDQRWIPNYMELESLGSLSSSNAENQNKSTVIPMGSCLGLSTYSSERLLYKDSSVHKFQRQNRKQAD